ncbi:hypothetical protein DACRYDRAFT_108367 [Dacryopinax primogenitus]|uniref:Uncharacterized protein n=1 Tax=Dacryopinax primogenitus (strain DJM 731) TaxID=1858805 RepID=M5FYQ7_DACPD|nr:uncharacterized protein DACRYDRAFT_108367 [Dacryopinax primogenitus]EJU01035.1 hypothetical protein DACRYDRAFT_108367 [Dacryopinax primogenitus]
MDFLVLVPISKPSPEPRVCKLPHARPRLGWAGSSVDRYVAAAASALANNEALTPEF